MIIGVFFFSSLLINSFQLNHVCLDMRLNGKKYDSISVSNGYLEGSKKWTVNISNLLNFLFCKLFSEQKVKPVRHPEELNCDFQQPENCRWTNSKSLDSLNFHLFEKQDHTVFPMLQVRPGPSKIEPGDKLIFVGDRKKTEQTALLTSAPIRCQNTTGKLVLE